VFGQAPCYSRYKILVPRISLELTQGDFDIPELTRLMLRCQFEYPACVLDTLHTRTDKRDVSRWTPENWIQYNFTFKTTFL